MDFTAADTFSESSAGLGASFDSSYVPQMQGEGDFLLVDDDETGDFFAPVRTDVIARLLSAYQDKLAKIEALAQVMTGDLSEALPYFIRGNASDDRRGTVVCENLFELSGAVADLNASFWKQLLDMTDLYSLMPQARRDQWNEQIMHPKGVKASKLTQWEIESGKQQEEWKIQPLPDFTEDTVRLTLANLVSSRSRFLAERVDGIFYGLSREHVTNCPEGFSKRMILANVFSLYQTFASLNHSKSGLITDLRNVIARFMGREELPHYASHNIIENARSLHTGEWVYLDGGAIRLRAYLKGTVHLEVHPDMAWRLNAILASLHPAAIPSAFRTRPKRKSKSWKLAERPLPAGVLNLLDGMKPAVIRFRDELKGMQTREIRFSLAFDLHYRSGENKNLKYLIKEAEIVLRAIGGVEKVEVVNLPDGRVRKVEYWQFSFDPKRVVSEIAASGQIPDQKAHQFYPTPDNLAEQLVEQAQIGPGMQVLEPSAGTGAISQHFPSACHATLVEVSPLHVCILKEQQESRSASQRVIQDDFLAYAQSTSDRFDRIVMNPPFSEGRAKAHTLAAMSLLKPGGKLVAILPAGMSKQSMVGALLEEVGNGAGEDCAQRLAAEWTESWTEPLANAFEGTSVSVVVYECNRAE